MPAFADPALQSTPSRTLHKERQTCRAVSYSWKIVFDFKELIALWHQWAPIICY